MEASAQLAGMDCLFFGRSRFGFYDERRRQRYPLTGREHGARGLDTQKRVLGFLFLQLSWKRKSMRRRACYYWMRCLFLFSVKSVGMAMAYQSIVQTVEKRCSAAAAAQRLASSGRRMALEIGAADDESRLSKIPVAACRDAPINGRQPRCETAGR